MIISDQRFTPEPVIRASYLTMGSIDCDPASSIEAQKLVQAKTFYTKETNGLDKEWKGNIFLNSPYSAPNLRLFTDKLIAEFNNGNTQQAIVVTPPDSSTNWCETLISNGALLCLTRKRLKFHNPYANNSGGLTSSFIFYIGVNQTSFIKQFNDIGYVMKQELTSDVSFLD